MRKDQLCSNCTADQCLCFRYSDSTILLSEFSRLYPISVTVQADLCQTRSETQAAQCSLVQNIYFGLQKIGSLCPKHKREIGNYRPKMAFL